MINPDNITNVRQQLSQLPCFQLLETISPVDTGFSSQCYTLTADGKKYFAKRVNSYNEVLMSIAASKQQLSPRVIFANEEWLITDYINSKNSAASETAQGQDRLIGLAIKLMVQCHRLNAKPEKMSSEAIINNLLRSTPFTYHQQPLLRSLADELTSPIAASRVNRENLVCCHGDLNFSNLILTPQDQAYLVDLECACMAPAEFDLAMFCAVNTIAAENLSMVIKAYHQQRLSITTASLANTLPINNELFFHYLRFCYFINGLWYFNASQQSKRRPKKTILIRQAKQQWHALNHCFDKDLSALFSRLGIKF